MRPHNTSPHFSTFASLTDCHSLFSVHNHSLYATQFNAVSVCFDTEILFIGFDTNFIIIKCVHKTGHCGSVILREETVIERVSHEIAFGARQSFCRSVDVRNGHWDVISVSTPIKTQKESYTIVSEYELPRTSVSSYNLTCVSLMTKLLLFWHGVFCEATHSTFLYNLSTGRL